LAPKCAKLIRPGSAPNAPGFAFGGAQLHFSASASKFVSLLTCAQLKKEPLGSFFNCAPSWTRTSDHQLKRLLLYRLSYRRILFNFELTNLLLFLSSAESLIAFIDAQLRLASLASLLLDDAPYGRIRPD
jgi:hypothetical protein